MAMVRIAGLLLQPSIGTYQVSSRTDALLRKAILPLKERRQTAVKLHIYEANTFHLGPRKILNAARDLLDGSIAEMNIDVPLTPNDIEFFKSLSNSGVARLRLGYEIESSSCLGHLDLGESLTSLSLSINKLVTSDLAELIARHPRLEDISLNARTSTLGWTSCFSNLTRLQTLSLSSEVLQAADLEPLGKLASLRSLSISAPLHPDIRILPFEMLEELHLDNLSPHMGPLPFGIPPTSSLSLWNFQLHKEWVSQFLNKSSCLKSLSLCNCEVLAPLDLMDSLTRLTIWNSQMNGVNCDGLSVQSRLKELRIPGSLLSVEARRCINGLSGLRVLDLGESQLNMEILSGLSTSNLVELRIAGSSSFGDIRETLGSCPHLRALDLSEMQIAANFDCLGSLQQLEHVRLVNCNLGDKGVEFLARLSKIRTLDLSGNPITALPNLGSRRKLRSLKLSNAQIGSAGLNSIDRFSGLQMLDLSHCPIADDDLQAICRNSQLLSLNVLGCPLSSSAVEKAAWSLVGCIMEGVVVGNCDDL